MSKINENKDQTNSKKFNEVAVDLKTKISESSKNLIYEAGKHYYQYLMDMKGEDDDCDYSTAFMMF